MSDMTGKVALVTGGSSGIGRAIARSFRSAGAAVVVTGRRRDVLEEAAAEIGATPVAGDVRDPAHAAQAVAVCVERFGGLTTLVNNAGVIGNGVGSSRVDLQACKLEYSIVSPK